MTHPHKFLILLIALITQLSLPAQGCKCISIPTLRKTYYQDFPNIVRAKAVVVQGQFPHQKVFFKIEQNYKGCLTRNRFTYESGGTSCDVSFSQGVSYILPISDSGQIGFNACQYLPSVESLSAEERLFLATRYICCRGDCKCSGPVPLILCKKDPCEGTLPPCPEAKNCVTTPCSRCKAEWFTEDGGAACEPRFPF